jgi:hypothetical protein
VEQKKLAGSGTEKEKSVWKKGRLKVWQFFFILILDSFCDKFRGQLVNALFSVLWIENKNGFNMNRNKLKQKQF